MKNWKTTFIGIVSAVGLTVLDLFQHGTVDPKTLVTAGAIALVGCLSKDFNVTGGTVVQ